ncbi:hypothetical protein BN8_01284 [Fibrisoma limi BUZ 3]|uniref:DUF3667 domain-containing protein n=1 Tax=Fibrisoma limi BUZ 3 TaxID=1185876 RepID=I2GEH0_9BACT|nr:DUF3667 domain-containing protein [Fibrisoma limi]CCH52295.1 hypothetical protein BN8_01284 [Fibrisoma limi BUZ 3]
MISINSTKQSHHHHDHLTSEVVACQNCDHEYTGRYCSQCGQRADTHRINWHYIWHEIPHSVWHVDHGIAYTLRQLTVRPGHTIREFLEGKRVNHYRPLALLLMLSAVLLFVQHGLGVSYMKASQAMLDSKQASADAQAFQNQLFEWMDHNQTLVYILMIPFLAFGNWFMFRRQRYNYPEMMVVQTFVTNFTMLMSLAIVVLFWALGGSVEAYKIIMGVSVVAMFGYYALTYYQLFQGRLGIFSVVWRSVVAYALSYLLFIALGMLIGIGYGVYLGITKSSTFKPEKPATTVQQSH